MVSEKQKLQSRIYGNHWYKTTVPTREDSGKMMVEAAEFGNFTESLQKKKKK